MFKSTLPRLVALLALAAWPLALQAQIDPTGAAAITPGANREAVIGLIGSATYKQQQLEPLIAQLEGEPEVGTLIEAVKLHEQAARSLSTSGRVGYAVAWGTELQGWYYARANVQRDNHARLVEVAKQLRAVEPDPEAEDVYVGR